MYQPVLKSPRLATPVLVFPKLKRPVLWLPMLAMPVLTTPVLNRPVLMLPALPMPVLNSPELPMPKLPVPVLPVPVPPEESLQRGLPPGHVIQPLALGDCAVAGQALGERQGQLRSGLGPHQLAKALDTDELELLELAQKVPDPLTGILADKHGLQFFRRASEIIKKPEEWERLSRELERLQRGENQPSERSPKKTK